MFRRTCLFLAQRSASELQRKEYMKKSHPHKRAKQSAAKTSALKSIEARVSYRGAMPNSKHLWPFLFITAFSSISRWIE